MACDDCEELAEWEERRRFAMTLAVQAFPPGDSRGPAGIVHAASLFYDFITPPDVEGVT